MNYRRNSAQGDPRAERHPERVKILALASGTRAIVRLDADLGPHRQVRVYGHHGGLSRGGLRADSVRLAAVIAAAEIPASPDSSPISARIATFVLSDTTGTAQ